MRMKVAFALVVHRENDDRVKYQQSDVLRRAGIDTSIFSVYSEEIVGVKRKLVMLRRLLAQYGADVVVCDNPLSVISAFLSKIDLKREKDVDVVYDVTEWYPSKKNMRNVSWPKKILRFPLMVMLSLLAGILCDRFVFGEYYKTIPFRQLFFWKPYHILSYYADFEKIKRYPVSSLKTNCTLFFAGGMDRELGFWRVLEVAKRLAERKPQMPILLKVVTSNSSHSICETELPSNLALEFYDYMSYEKFCSTVGDADFYFDLRDNDIEYTHCLPIKLFYYMAMGKIPIYSDLKAIRREVPEMNDLGCCNDPNRIDEITDKLMNYLDDEDLYRNSCKRFRKLAEEKYNWIFIEKPFVQFISHKF